MFHWNILTPNQAPNSHPTKRSKWREITGNPCDLFGMEHMMIDPCFSKLYPLNLCLNPSQQSNQNSNESYRLLHIKNKTRDVQEPILVLSKQDWNHIFINLFFQNKIKTIYSQNLQNLEYVWLHLTKKIMGGKVLEGFVLFKM